MSKTLTIIFLGLIYCPLLLSQQLMEFSAQDCSQNSSLEFFLERIIDSTYSDRELSIRVAVIGECGTGADAGFHLYNDTLELIYGIRQSKKGFISSNMCDCLYTLNYKIKGILNQKYTILYSILSSSEGRPIQKLPYEFFTLMEAKDSLPITHREVFENNLGKLLYLAELRLEIASQLLKEKQNHSLSIEEEYFLKDQYYGLKSELERLMIAFDKLFDRSLISESFYDENIEKAEERYKVIFAELKNIQSSLDELGISLQL